MTISANSRLIIPHFSAKKDYSDLVIKPSEQKPATTNRETQLLASFNPPAMLKTIRKAFVHKNYNEVIQFCEQNIGFIKIINQDPTEIEAFLKANENKDCLKILRYYAISLGEAVLSNKKEVVYNALFALIQNTKVPEAKQLERAIILLKLVQPHLLRNQTNLDALEGSIYQQAIQRFSDFYEETFNQKVPELKDIIADHASATSSPEQAFNAVV